LDKLLKENDVEQVYIGGLALDYCVMNTALDAVDMGYKTFVLWDASRGIFRKKSEEEVKKELLEKGVEIVVTGEVLRKLI
jgi:nicotinamidase/pyrazinamidase